MTGASPPDPDAGGVERFLGPLETAVLRALWACGEGTVSDVMDAVNADTRSLAHNTILTTLTRLQAKGVVTRHRMGKRHVYRPVSDEAGTVRSLSRSAVDDVVARHGPSVLAAFAERLNRLTPDEREALRAIAEDDE